MKHSIRQTLLCLGLVAAHAFAAPEYDIIDLGILGGSWAQANGLNNVGQVVGSSQDTEGCEQAFVWQNGRMTGLGFLPEGSYSKAMDINDHGDITGQAQTSPSSHQAFIYSNGSMTPIGTLGGANSIGRAINNRGTITGSSGISNSTHNHTFVWKSGQHIHIRPFSLSVSCDSYGINEDDRICGITFVYSPWDRWWPYVWHDDNQNGTSDSGEMKLLGNMGRKDSVGEFAGANAINNHGWVVGWSSVANYYTPQHAFLVVPSNGVWKLPSYSNTDPTNLLMRSLGTLATPTNNSRANAINDHAWIVGHSETETGQTNAFLWRDEVMHNLNDLVATNSSWELITATGINNANEIIGNGLRNGQPRAFILRRQGRIHDLQPTYETNATWITTNELNEVTTQHILRVVAYDIQWSGVWSTNKDERHEFTVEASSSLKLADWQPLEPATQWPTTQNHWSLDVPANTRTRFYRVKAQPIVEPVPDP